MAPDASPKRKPTILILAAVLTLVLAGFLYTRVSAARLAAGADVGDLWFIDESAPADAKPLAGPDALPPIQLAGKTVVRAYVFSCGSCADEAARFVGYLEKFSTPMQEDFAKSGVTRYEGQGSIGQFGDNELTQMLGIEGRLVKLPAGKEWFDYFTPDGVAVRRDAAKKCTTGPVRACNGPSAKD